MSTTKHTPPVPWRIEGRATPFSPWATIRRGWNLEAMCAEAERVKRVARYYVVRVRAF